MATTPPHCRDLDGNRFGGTRRCPSCGTTWALKRTNESSKCAVCMAAGYLERSWDATAHICLHRDCTRSFAPAGRPGALCSAHCTDYLGYHGHCVICDRDVGPPGGVIYQVVPLCRGCLESPDPDVREQCLQTLLVMIDERRADPEASAHHTEAQRLRDVSEALWRADNPEPDHQPIAI